MKIAYIILAHELPKHLVRFVKKLRTDTTSFLIHVDKTTGESIYVKMMDLLRTYENVHFLKRYVCTWGAFGHVQASLARIRDALALNLEFDYAILLTGQDYPIRSNGYIQKFLEDGNRQSYLGHFSLPNAIWKSENGGVSAPRLFDACL